ncbi:GATOR complex protein MIOS-A [Copidosoma floridanum]|uniref:GATOR complex protein MIOS-A n=1 Tax=Copidosoma floridanum TaxID=29053 RepID=UPI000C6F84D4|nr:GATOR complex protein MIOS-A [Copidosoma floridanum]
MTSVKLEVQWSPIHPNKFITWGTEIYLYEIAQLKESVRPSCIKVSDETVAHLLASSTSYPYVKCIDIYPHPEPDILLAVGQANGKIALATFGPTIFDALGIAGKEFVPKHARQCNAVAWNPVDTNILVSGLDKYRTDQSLLLWDVSKSPLSTERAHHYNASQVEMPKPIAETGNSETIHSLSWFKNEPKCLVAGANNKQLKIVDFRDSVKVVNTTSTKAVFSLAVNPHNDHYLVSQVDNQIIIWDTRSFEKPLLTLLQQKPVTKVLWCPTRQSLLGSLQKDSGSLYLHDIQHYGTVREDAEPGALERTIAPSWANPTSFSWHPTHVNRFLGISQQGLTDYTVNERITLNWSARSHLVWNHSSKTFKYICSSDKIYKDLGDISILTKKRAMAGYGLLPELAQNGELAEDETLKNLWQWLYLSRSLVEDGTIATGVLKHPGIRTVLKLDGQTGGFVKSEIVHRPWADIGSNHTAKTYRSPDRDKALQLCGWRFEKDSNMPYNNLFIERLEREGTYSRASAISVFNLGLRQAIEILNRGASKMSLASNLHIVAMALSGFSEEKSSMWRELCLKSRAQLTDPYLRATFAFLTADSDSYENVLNESGVAVEDRVAFALMFLSDAKLCDYINKLTQSLLDEGYLAGFLLTGANSEGIRLLHRYLDITGDVQSCSLIAVRALEENLLKEPEVLLWIESYRNLLDSWKMWNQRAHFDIIRGTTKSEKPSHQMYISCHFCGKSISTFMQGFARVRNYGKQGSQVKSTCINCRKPLPRCAICLMHMGTITDLPSGNKNDDENKITEFSSWFTWCQTCRHGGHANHIIHWFQQHSECPVTSCTCRCFSLDASCKTGAV